MQTEVFARVDGGDEETRSDTRYYWDNARRSESNRINLQLTLAGEAFWEDERGRQRVAAGKLMLFTQRENSRYGYPATARSPYHLRYLSIDPAATIIPLFKRLRQDFGSIVSCPHASEPAKLFDEIYHRFKNRSFRDRYHESELIVRLLTALYRQQVEETQASDPIEYGYHLLQNRYATPLSLAAVAQECGITREHFARAFHERYGEAPGVMLRQLRLRQAAAMLESTQMSVNDIALACGFSSANVFCRAFRRERGCTPLSLRQTP